MNPSREWKFRIGFGAGTALLVAVALSVMGARGFASSPQNQASIQSLRAAKAELQAGLNGWNSDRFAAARDLFIGLVLREKNPNAFLFYYVALADYRLATFHLGAGNSADADRFVAEGEQYLVKAMEADPNFGESFSLYGYVLGLEVALHQERAMEVGLSSMTNMDQGIAKAPDNPRVYYLKGTYLTYVPEEYGGGLERAIPLLEKAVSLFEKESIQDEIRPSWGREEALAFLGLTYKKKGDMAKAREFLRKALDVNPEFGLAKSELAALGKGQ